MPKNNSYLRNPFQEIEFIVMITICIISGIALLLGFLVWASATINSRVYVRAFCRLKDSAEKVVYLTFDDGPDPVNTPKVLDVLKQHNATATFFMIGKKLPGQESLALRVIAEGHRIGNHTSTHTGTFPLLGTKKMLVDMGACSSMLESVTATKVYLFRPPFGVTNPTIGTCVKKLGYSVVGWNIRTFDTKNPDPEYVIFRIKKKLVPGSVILLHDRLPESSEILERVLSFLESEGYEFNRQLPV